MCLDLSKYIGNDELPNEVVVRDEECDRPFIINDIVCDRGIKKESNVK